MKETVGNYLKPLKSSRYRSALALSLAMLLVSLFINFFAGIYATEKASNSVTDIILSNIRVYDLDAVFIYGSWVLVAFIIYLAVKHPWRAPYVIKNIALFVVIRAIFISMTHIGPFPTEVVLNPSSFINYFVFGGDLFFSGHTGLPFLLAFVFWDYRRIRYAFIIISIFFGIVVLLAHLHYTIDVLSAFFISFGIYHIAEKLFKRDKELFSTAS